MHFVYEIVSGIPFRIRTENPGDEILGDDFFRIRNSSQASETKFVYETTKTAAKFVYESLDFVYEREISYTKSRFVYEIRIRKGYEKLRRRLFVGGGDTF